MKMRGVLFFLVALGGGLILEAAESAAPDKIWVRFCKSGANRGMDSEDALLFLDEAGGRLEVRHGTHPLAVRFGDIRKVVFEVSRHMRGGVGLAWANAAGIPVASEAYTGDVYDFWCLLRYQGPGDQTLSYLMELRKETAGQILGRMRALLGERVEVADFPEQEKEVEKDSLKAIDSRQDMEVDKVNHPVPETRPDKALVVVVCPWFPTGRSEPKIFQQKLHANDQVVAINKMGTYCFCYLDPGAYRLISQASNATGFAMALEAGKDYYFFQNTYIEMSFLITVKTSLTRQTKELALYELNGAKLSVWKKKN